MTRPQVFSAEWFGRHQRALLLALRAPVIGGELRAALGIKSWDCGHDRRIVALRPDSYTVRNPDGTFTSDFRTHRKYAKRLHRELLPLWRAAHEWDRFLANPLCPALNLGFDTLTAYPDAGNGATTCDGYVARTGDLDWATIKNSATADTVNDTDATWIAAGFRCSGTTNNFSNLYRSIYTFDTSSIGSSGTTVNSATLSLYGEEVYGGAGTPCQNDLGWDISYRVSGLDPGLAAYNALSSSDYSNLTATQASAPVVGSSLVLGYNDFVLNTFGKAQIAKTGITALGLRDSKYDGTGFDPSSEAWFAFAQAKFVVDFADFAGTSQDPKLVVTFTVVAVPTPFRTSMISRGRR